VLELDEEKELELQLYHHRRWWEMIMMMQGGHDQSHGQ
jgi:hypothetical protein